jgi:hypothetical protein
MDVGSLPSSLFSSLPLRLSYTLEEQVELTLAAMCTYESS